jgi:hypothetical protein
MQISPKKILSEFKRLFTKTVMSSGANVLLMTKRMVLAYLSGLMVHLTSDNGKITQEKVME